MHLVSNVRAQLAEGKDGVDVVRAAFPAGTLSGAPKMRAMEIIDELEKSRPYGGAVGYLRIRHVDLGIAIRTLVPRATARGKAGAGIVAMLLVIDNYDSFTYNLVQYLGELGEEVRVVRNDESHRSRRSQRMAPEHIVISPGPCTPNEAGISLERHPRAAPGKIPILGVCLGHQAIGQAFGGKVVRASEVDARQDLAASSTTSKGRLRRRCRTRSRPPATTRWWSSASSLPDCLEVTAKTWDEEIMGLRHKTLRGRGGAVPPRVVPDHRRQGSAAQLRRQGRPVVTAGHPRGRRPLRSREALARLVGAQGPRGRRDGRGGGPDHGRRGHARPGRRAADRRCA